jgi:hypothetical protein
MEEENVELKTSLLHQQKEKVTIVSRWRRGTGGWRRRMWSSRLPCSINQKEKVTIVSRWRRGTGGWRMSMWNSRLVCSIYKKRR